MRATTNGAAKATSRRTSQGTQSGTATATRNTNAKRTTARPATRSNASIAPKSRTGRGSQHFQPRPELTENLILAAKDLRSLNLSVQEITDLSVNPLKSGKMLVEAGQALLKVAKDKKLDYTNLNHGDFQKILGNNARDVQRRQQGAQR